MASQIEIVNQALVHCGEATITSLNEEGKAARVVKRVYDVVLRQMLTKYRWYFAVSRRQLAADPATPEFGFTYKHQIPEDMIQLIGIGDSQESNRNYTASEIVYKREGQYILSDESPLNIVYTRYISDASQYSPEFVEAFSYQLATTIFYDLTKGTDRYNALVGERERSLKRARFAGAIQNTPEIITASAWVDSRFQDGYPFRIGPVTF